MTRRLFVLRGTMQTSSRWSCSCSNANLREHDHSFGHVSLAGAVAVDPVTHRAGLERAAHDVVEIDLAREPLVDEQAERVGGVGHAVTIACRASGGERGAVAREIGLAGGPLGLPRQQPVLVAAPDAAPVTVIGWHERPHHHPPPVEAERCVQSTDG